MITDRSTESGVRGEGASLCPHAALPALQCMPERLVMVRHGESEANLINRALKAGIISEYPSGFSAIPDREIRLSAAGREQAQSAGRWLSEHYPGKFDVIYTSDHTRAKETAAYLCIAAGWGDVQIRIDPLVGERNWGRFSSVERERQRAIMEYRTRDPLHNPMPDGETLLETRHRSRELLDRCAREFTGKRVLVISHGEFIEAIWSEMAHMSTEQQLDFFNSERGNIRNCQIVEFSSTDPATQIPSPQLGWSRSSCAHAGIDGDWFAIERKSFTPAELMEQVNRYPALEFS